MGCCCVSSAVDPAPKQTSSKSTSASGVGLTYHNKRVKLLPPLEVNVEKDQKSRWSPVSQEDTTKLYVRKTFDDSESTTDHFINVLLLGESGVGKSTFINALVNYLTFDTLKQARSGEPIALMPVSFLITAGDQFEEQTVRFGAEDANEDHYHPGQSVTQHCRSYVFPISTHGKLRLIDTPGMGDTRGVDQDDLNMQQILSFINNLSHLNAICILLKPNESKLNVVFRSYFTRLISFLGANFGNKIIFCFTNTRATFFAPGNTGPLLKSMLKSHSNLNIPFAKANTFCFDNESFRYLIALKNGIKFDDYQKDEYQQSWVTSVTESNRLLLYICNELKAYPQSEWRSIEHAAFQANQMIRPILETIRNLFRSLILRENNSSSQSITLCPTVLSRPSTICTSCDRNPQRYGDYWILLDNLHIRSEKCATCKHSPKEHFNVDYKLAYISSADADTQSVHQIKNNLHQLKPMIIELGYFLLCMINRSEPNDRVLSFLNQIIEEEKQICDEKDRNCLNPSLYEKLNQFKEEYEQRQNKTTPNRNSINLKSIYQLIQNINKNDLIKEHIRVIKQYHQDYMTKQEKVV